MEKRASREKEEIVVTDEERIKTAKRAGKRNVYAREHGVCVRCHKSFEPNGHTVCPRCRKEVDEILAKRREER